MKHGITVATCKDNDEALSTSYDFAFPRQNSEQRVEMGTFTKVNIVASAALAKAEGREGGNHE